MTMGRFVSAICQYKLNPKYVKLHKQKLSLILNETKIKYITRNHAKPKEKNEIWWVKVVKSTWRVESDLT